MSSYSVKCVTENPYHSFRPEGGSELERRCMELEMRKSHDVVVLSQTECPSCALIQPGPRLKVSSNWTPAERMSVTLAIMYSLQRTILLEAAQYNHNAEQIRSIITKAPASLMPLSQELRLKIQTRWIELLAIVLAMSSRFLENNRKSFGEFVEQ